MKLDMNRAWSRVTTMLNSNREIVLTISGLFFFLPYLAFVLLLPDVSTMFDQLAQSGDPMTEEQMNAFLASLPAGFWIAVAALGLVQATGVLSLLCLIGDSARPTAGEAIRRGLAALPTYIGVLLLQMVAFMLAMVLPLGLTGATGNAFLTLLGMALALWIAVWLYARFSVVQPVIVSEKTFNPVSAMIRSWELTGGNAWRIVGFFLLLLIAYLVASAFVSLVFGLLFYVGGETVQTFGNALVGAFTNAVGITLMAAAVAAVHRQLAGIGRETVDIPLG